jgi:hypothetical protein
VLQEPKTLLKLEERYKLEPISLREQRTVINCKFGFDIQKKNEVETLHKNILRQVDQGF